MAQAQSPGGASLLSPFGVLAFACAYMPFAALQLSVAVQLPPFFATQLGLGLSAGAAFGVVRLIDIPVDPALGLMIDKTRTPLGRYRPWMMAGVPILMLALYMLFQAQAGITEGYLIVWLLVVYLGMSMQLVAGNSWASSLAPNYQARSRIFGTMLAMGVFGTICCLFIPAIAHQTGHADIEGMRWVGWFLFALAPASAAIALARTPERVVERSDARAFRLGDYFRLLGKENVLRIVVADFCVTMGPGWMAALYLYFFRDSRQLDVAVSSLLLALYVAAGLVGGPATAWLANRISKHRALIVSTTFYSLFLIIIPLLPKGQWVPTLVPMFLLGALATGFVVMVRAITADVADELRLEGGRDLTGLLYAITSATTKAAGALSIFVSFWLLGLQGYSVKQGAVNDAAHVRALELIYITGPIVFVMLGGAAFLGYRLSADRHAEIRRQLDERDAEAAVLQVVTGEPHELPAEPAS